MQKPEILVVDDEPGIHEAIRSAFAAKDYTVRCADSFEAAEHRLEESLPDLVFLDIRLPREGGIQLLGKIRSLDPSLPVVMITGYATIETAVSAMRLGAHDYVEKPFRLPQIARIGERALESRGRAGNAGSDGEEGGRGARDPEGGSRAEGELVGESPVFRKVLRLIDRVAKTPSTTVLIRGESGTGKELVARSIHDKSDRAGRPFVALNCAAISETLLEAELFGYEKGAFTGALAEGKPGLFEVARGGTVLLDEIGEMPVLLQAKLLRVLQEKNFKRVQGVEDIAFDTRIIASTNRNLEEAIDRGQFREDLYYRISVMPIELPPLRERPTDIDLLARHFLECFNEEHDCYIQEFSPAATERLQRYPWPGNARELRNTIERAVIQTPGTVIQESHLGLWKQVQRDGGEWVLALQEPTIREAERLLIEQVLKRANGNISRSARMLGINRSTLYHKLREYAIDPASALV